ncbi:hypothetical protein B0T22DRAFT_440794 [Podospora appendiculata]|uniref:WD-like domain-containing protein n=1 Tax=Podospora appendiculata TaxID=314037 RepID=A0AAE1CD91_9PEZI|nr:hypothetical protein B0T22DRAFT_440794 [Podospora appendiculata]
MFIKTTLMLGAFFATLATALPQPEATTPSGLVILDQFETEFGTATWYGDASPDTSDEIQHEEASQLDKRCGTNQVACSSDHRAPVSLCNDLINTIRARGSDFIPASPRSFCLSSGGTCCVSWANVVTGAVWSTLINSANKLVSQCNSGGNVSGLTRDTLVGSTCTTQCLSNRATGCK